MSIQVSLLYVFADPFGSGDSKLGLTTSYEVRLGVYQNSYSKKSHTACFDRVYVGPPKAIANLEKAVKQHFDWSIERDGRGHTEWVSQTVETIETEIDKIVDGYKFKVVKVPREYLPLTVDNKEHFEMWLSENVK